MGICRYLNKSFSLGQTLVWLWTSLVILLLGAHFYRDSEYGIVLCVAGILILFCSSASWKRWTVGLFLLWGMLEWGYSASTLAQIRMTMGMPWIRGTLILSAVAFITGLTGLAITKQAALLSREQETSDAFLRASVFMTVFLCLFYIRKFAPLDLLLLERFFPRFGPVEIFLAAWYASFATRYLMDPQRSRKTRTRLWLLFACIFFAQFFLGILGIPQMLLTGQLHTPVPAFILYGAAFRESLNIMPFIVLISTLLVGSAWCSMLCYFGPFDSLASQEKNPRPIPLWLQKLLRWGRIAVLISGVGMTFVLKHLGISTGSAISISIAYAAVSLLVMASLSRRYGGMMHCTTVCPMGLVVNLLGRLSPWRIRVDKNMCSNCGACEKICRWRAITPESRKEGKTLLRCSLCRDCVGACGKKAITLYCAGLAPESSARLFVALLASLHTIFLACAMV